MKNIQSGTDKNTRFFSTTDWAILYKKMSIGTTHYFLDGFERPSTMCYKHDKSTIQFCHHKSRRHQLALHWSRKHFLSFFVGQSWYDSETQKSICAPIYQNGVLLKTNYSIFLLQEYVASFNPLSTADQFLIGWYHELWIC